MPTFSNWVKNTLGLWVPGSGARFAVEQGGVSKAVEIGSSAGNIPFIDNSGVLKAPTIGLTNGLQLSQYGNLIVETSGEYGLVGWNIITGTVDANYDARFGGPNILYGSGVLTHMYTGVHIYSPVTFRDYWLSFSLETLASGATFDYQVELYDSTNGTLLGTIIPWTAVGTGVHVVDLSAGTWPSSPPSGDAFLRIHFRSTDTARLRLVSVMPDEPGLPDPNRLVREYNSYHRMVNGLYYPWRAANGVTVGSGLATILSEVYTYVPAGYRVKVGRVSYSLINGLRARIQSGGYWTSPSSTGITTANSTLSGPATAASNKLISFQAYNPTTSSITISPRNTIVASVWVLPF